MDRWTILFDTSPAAPEQPADPIDIKNIKSTSDDDGESVDANMINGHRRLQRTKYNPHRYSWTIRF